MSSNWGVYGIDCSNGLLSANLDANWHVIGTMRDLQFRLSPLETYHALPLERINSSTAFAAFGNGGAAAIIITQNTTASQAKC